MKISIKTLMVALDALNQMHFKTDKEWISQSSPQIGDELHVKKWEYGIARDEINRAVVETNLEFEVVE